MITLSCTVRPPEEYDITQQIVIQTNYTYVTNVIIETNLITETLFMTNSYAFTNLLSLTNVYTNINSVTNFNILTNLNWMTNYSTNYTELTNWVISTNVNQVTNTTQLSNIGYYTNTITNLTWITNIQWQTNYLTITNYYTMTNSGPLDLSDPALLQLHGAVLTNGLTTNALYLDGSTYASISNQDSVNFTGTSLTISVWIKWDADPFAWRTANDYANIISKNGDSQWQLGHAKNNRKFQFSLQTANGNYVVTGTTQPARNSWYHLAAVYDGSNITLYVNGTLEGSVPASGLILTSTSDVNIGRRSVNNDRYFKGFVDRIGIYSSAWSAEAVQFEYIN